MRDYYCNAEYMEDKLEALEKENAELKRQIKMLELERLDEQLCRAFYEEVNNNPIAAEVLANA